MKKEIYEKTDGIHINDTKNPHFPHKTLPCTLIPPPHIIYVFRHHSLIL